MRGTIIIFAKAPRAGAVKTRLGRDVGMGRAASIFRSLVVRTIGEAKKVGCRVMIAVDPPGALTGFDTVFDLSVQRIPQGVGSLGDRMALAFQKAPAGPVVVIGADAPAMRAAHLRHGIAALGGHDAVFGPAKDGGYWLIGLARRRAAPDLFSGVRWSTRHALTDTVQNLPPSFKIAMLEEMQDIDCVNDLAAMGPRSTAR